MGLKYDAIFPTGERSVSLEGGTAFAWYPVRHFLFPSLPVYSTQLPFGSRQHLVFAE